MFEELSGGKRKSNREEPKGNTKLVVQVSDSGEKNMSIELFARNTGVYASDFVKSFDGNMDIKFKLE